MGFVFDEKKMYEGFQFATHLKKLSHPVDTRRLVSLTLRKTPKIQNRGNQLRFNSSVLSCR